MAAYLLVRLKVHDKARFLQYAAAARQIARRYGARYLVAGRPVEVLEASEPIQPIVLTQWPSVEAIREFWSSAEYREAVELRSGAADVTAVVFESLPADFV